MALLRNGIVERSGNGTLSPASGGTGTSIVFTKGSVVFAGTSGIYTQDNANFFWDDTNDNLLLGKNTNNSNGRIQLATHTTSAGGIGLGTDVQIFRSGTNALAVTGADVTITAGNLTLSSGGSLFAAGSVSSTNGIFGSGASTMTLKLSGTTALTLAQTTLNATFVSTTDATNTSSGSIVTAGGVGIAKALFVGTSMNVGGVFSVDTGGSVGASNFKAFNGSANGIVSFGSASTSTQIARNLGDAISALQINQVHASSTGNILDLQAAGVTKVSFLRNGDATFAGTITAVGVTTSGANQLSAGSTVNTLVANVDGTATGPVTNSFNAGYTTALGDLVYLDSSATWQKTAANSSSTYIGLLGIVLQASITSGNPVRVALPGSFVYMAAAFPTFTVGGNIYMSETAGAVTQTQPTTTDAAIRVVGYAVHADKMYFSPSPDYVTAV